MILLALIALMQASPAKAEALKPAFLQRCQVDPTQVVANDQPVDPGEVKVEQSVFTLTLAEGAIPISITPRNLAVERDDLVHLSDGVPRLDGDRVVLDIRYQYPLMNLPPSDPGESSATLGRVLTEGQLKVDVRRMSFELEQTMSMHLDLNIPVSSRQDVVIKAKGTCIERAMPVEGPVVPH